MTLHGRNEHLASVAGDRRVTRVGPDRRLGTHVAMGYPGKNTTNRSMTSLYGDPSPGRPSGCPRVDCEHVEDTVGFESLECSERRIDGCRERNRVWGACDAIVLEWWGLTVGFTPPQVVFTWPRLNGRVVARRMTWTVRSSEPGGRAFFLSRRGGDRR